MLHERGDETVPGDDAPRRHFHEQVERLAEPPLACEEAEQCCPGVRVAAEQAALEDVRVQLRGAAGAQRRRGREDRREGERGRGDARGEHAREQREGVGGAAGAGAGGDEGVEVGCGEERRGVPARHSVAREAGMACGEQRTEAGGRPRAGARLQERELD